MLSARDTSFAVFAVGLALAALTTALPSDARADEEPEEPEARQAIVGLLPPAPDQERLAVYRTPIAAALARGLAALDGIAVQRIAVDGEIPVRVALVVDVRLNTVDEKGDEQGNQRVELVVGVRDPVLGRTVARFSSGPTRLTALDGVVDRAVAALAADVRAALAARRARRAAAASDDASVELPVTVIPGIAPEQADGRPRIVVLQAAGDVRGDRRATSRIATEEAYRLVDSLGFRPQAAPSPRGAAAATYDQAAAVARRAAAAAVLKIQVVGIRFEYLGVLTARGVVRVVLVGAGGEPLYDRVVQTGTLVGSRGDTSYALVRYAARQALQIAGPRMARALAEADS